MECYENQYQYQEFPTFGVISTDGYPINKRSNLWQAQLWSDVKTAITIRISNIWGDLDKCYPINKRSNL